MLVLQLSPDSDLYVIYKIGTQFASLEPAKFSNLRIV